MKTIVRFITCVLLLSSFAQGSTPPKYITIALVTSNGVVTRTINERSVNEADLNDLLHKLYKIDRQQTLMICADYETPLGSLVSTVEQCRGIGFRSFRIFSHSDDNCVEIRLSEEKESTPVDMVVESFGRSL